jgi:hypothetical protein
MSNFPVSLDDDTTLPAVNNNIDEIGDTAINALRDATFAVECNIGIGAAGTADSVASRLAVSFNPDGTLKTSALTSLGLVTLPITQDQIANNAGIPESKLMLDHRTQDLFNYIQDLSNGVNTALGWISSSGVKLEAHLIGAIYRHTLDQIDVSVDLTHFPFFDNKFSVPRNNTNAYFAINDINSELLAHQWADGTPFGIIQNVVTNNGSTYPSDYAHTASGIFLNTSRFAVIPQTAQDVQAFADFIDGASILTLGTRIQNLYHNGISRNSRSSSLTADGYGQALVPVTPAIAYLRGNGNSSIPIDDIAIGEDIIQFMPSSTNSSNNSFDEQFALVRPGDIVTISYAGDGYNVEVPFVISEKKYIQGGGNKIYIVRIAGKNIAYSPNASARIDRPLFNQNKYGVLAVAGVDSPTTVPPSLIVVNPRGAQCMGVNFSPDQFNETHYLLYLALFTTGNPLDGYTILPGIDVTGNLGKTPGSYTLDSVVYATNQAFRKAGFNYRFIAFQKDGEFGIALADSINNASFSVISAVVSGAGSYDQTSTQLNFPNNVIDVFPAVGITAPDPLGFGPFGANIASPPFQETYGSPQAAQFPTYLFPPLRRNNYYVNGAERELLNLDVNQVLDTYGDGFWTATIDGYTDNPGPPGHVTVTYGIPLDLSASKLKAGKTIVVQPLNGNTGIVNYGRFIIQSVNFSCCPPIQTEITVYDGVHGTGVSPSLIAPVGTQVAIYLSASSVSFSGETATDFTAISAAFKRHFEVYVDIDGNTFTHERGRLNVNGNVSVNGVTLYNSLPQLGQMDIVSISPKLRGYQFGPVNKITLQISSFDTTSGLFTGNLASYDGAVFGKQGPTVSGKIGEKIRFYDESNVDYIDVIFEFGNTIPTFTNQFIDIQLFPTLSLDQEVMLLASCQERSDTNTVTQIVDLRQFGNTSEEEFTTSALNFVSLPERLLHFNGVVRGFDGYVAGAYGNDGLFISKGGLALVNGNFVDTNQQIFTVPPLQEIYTAIAYPINYALCVTTGGDLVTIVLTDFDSILGTPNAPNRIVTVNNLVSGNTYQVDSNTFSYILNNRKDLTILYVVSATVTGSGNSAATTLTVRDVRRFINDADSSIPAVLTSDNSQGNFKTLAAALNWLKLNSAFQDELQVKGAFSLASDPGLNFPLDIIGQGSAATLVFNGSMNMSNVTFNGINVTFNAALTATNVTFNDCTVTFNGATTFNNVIIDPSVINVNALISNTGSSVIRDTTINVSIAQGFAIGNGLKFQNCTFNYTYNPLGGSPTYSTTDLVNVGSGLMYANVSTSLSDVMVDKCTFNNTLADHFPFISIQLGGPLSDGYGAYAQNISITGNKFNSQFVGNDRRAVVAITSNLLAVQTIGVYPALPKVVNIIINGNECNYDQIILLSTARPVSTLSPTPMTGSMLACDNCTINDNICGTIGYMTAADLPASGDNSEPANLGTIRDKTDQLTIAGNTCKLITNLDAIGQYIPFKATDTNNFDWVQVSTGGCAIEKNQCSWILVGASAWMSGASYATINGTGIRISRNRLTVGNPAFLTAYRDVSNSNITPPAIGILLRQETSSQSDFSASDSVISENILENRTWFDGIGPTFASFQYTVGIKCEASANIYGNIIGNIINTTNPMVFLGGTSTGGPTIRFQNNTLNRKGSTVSAYVQAANSNAINTVTITNNTFDLPTIDGVSTAVGLNIPPAWAFHTNINQTAYLAISPTDYVNYAQLGIFQSNTNNSNTAGGARPADAIFVDTTNKYMVARFIPWINLFPPPGFGPAAQYMTVSDYDCTAGAASRNYSFTVPLDNALPIGVKIISVNMGIWLQTNVATLDIGADINNQYTLSLIPFNPTATSNSAHGVADVKSNLSFFGGPNDISENIAALLQSTFFVGGSTTANERQISDLTSATQYMTISASQIAPLQSTFTTDGNHRIAATFDLNYVRTGGSTSAHFVTWYLSPIVVQYRW